jgi:hypothetical protein
MRPAKVSCHARAYASGRDPSNAREATPTGSPC